MNFIRLGNFRCSAWRRGQGKAQKLLAFRFALRAYRCGQYAAKAQRGSGTVLALAIIAVLTALTVLITGLIQAQAAAGRARSAADLTALGGASALTSTLAPGDPCAVAQKVAQANGAVISSCTISGEDVTVSVQVKTQILGINRQAVATARAGPANEVPGV